jgi:hypothetical protein
VSSQHHPRADALLEPEDRARALNADVDHYLRTHVPSKTGQPEFLVSRDQGTVWLVRWPNGSVKWESSAALRARRIAIPHQPLVGTVD